MPAFNWYEKVSDASMEQGDFLFDVEVPSVQKTDSDSPDVEFKTYDAIVISQSCDIPKLRVLLLCPVWPREQAADVHQDFGRNKGLENLRKGRYTQFHLLNRCEIPSLKRDFMIVQFDHPIVLDKEIIADHLAQQNPRLSLLPPYREHLAQAFARSFMRVGLPIDIPAFR